LIDNDGNKLYHSGKFVVEGSVLNVSKANQLKQEERNQNKGPQQEESKLKARLQFEAVQLQEKSDLEEFSKMKEMMMLSQFGPDEYLEMLARCRAIVTCKRGIL
jgi:hypothetical protein